MTKKQKKPLNPPKTYKRKFKCNNCSGKTDCPAWYSGKIFCQKCTLYKKIYKEYPTKERIEDLKLIGRWKR